METNQNPAHENPAQPIVPETSATVQPGQQLVPGQPNAQSASEQPATAPEQSVPEPQPDQPAPAGQLYDPNEAAQIVLHLTDGYFDPEYILLFGKLVGDTPHRDAAAYNQLVVVREIPSCDWFHNQCILHYKMPYRHRKITYINLFILPLNYGIEPHDVPLFRLCQW